MLRFLPLLVVASLINVASPAEPAPAARSKLDGIWVFDSVKPDKGDNLNRVWMSIVIVEGDSFSISNIMRNPAPLKGKFVFDQANPKHVDLTNEELDFSYFGGPFKWSATKRKALYEFVDDNRVRIAFPDPSEGPRPKDFKPSSTVHVIELCRAPKGFKEFPKEITLTVVNADGKPVEGASVCDHYFERLDIKDTKSGMQLRAAKKTGSDGKTKISMWDPPFVIRDEKSKEMAIPRITPATCAGGSIKAILTPECGLKTSFKCDELTKARESLSGFVLLYANGMRIGTFGKTDGTFEFPVPPGTYTLHAYGENLHSRTIEVTVPAGQSTFEMRPIEMKASSMALMKGKPAPEFVDVVGWTGKPTKLADLKGRYVLVEFWGYWCGPCVHAMPVLIELHEKFHDKGLTVIGVHVDSDGDVDTVAKYDEMNSVHVKEIWKGKKLPFSNALVSGKLEGDGDDRIRGGTPKLYGVLGYPTTVLIDREGKIVGRFNARDRKEAIAQMEKLLAENKK